MTNAPNKAKAESLAKTKKQETQEKSVEQSPQNDKQAYDILKQKVQKLEKDNFSRLILFQSGKGWYKMGGNSLLIYYYDISGPLFGKKPNVLSDTDYTKTLFEDGLISFCGTDSLEKRLERVGVLKEKRVGKRTVVFELNFTVTKEIIESHLLDFNLERKRALEVLSPKFTLEPEIYDKIRHLERRIFEIVRNTTVFEREYNGMKLCRHIQEITRCYKLMNYGRLPETEGWEKILEEIDELSIEISSVIELKIWSQDTSVSIATKLIKLKHLCEKKAAEILEKRNKNESNA